MPLTFLRQAGGIAFSTFVVIALGCLPPADLETTQGELGMIWGSRGEEPGKFLRPRAVTIDQQDQLYIVDYNARIQVLSGDGTFLREWSTPTHEFGRPNGLAMGNDGNLLVADTHYHQVLFYSPEGELLKDRSIGGTKGPGPGEFSFVTDVVQDSEGNYYISETREQNRIQKFSPSGEYLLEWGQTGSSLGEFLRPQNLAIDDNDHIWVADACNHRIQVFDTQGELLRVWGSQGSAPGQLYYPYDLVLDRHGHVFVCEYGNHRVQKFTLAGESLGTWGSHGRRPGQLNGPWAVILDSQDRLYVLDTENHRVQRIIM